MSNITELTKDELLSLIKSSPNLIVDGDFGPGVYQENILAYLGEKTGKVFKNLFGNFLSLQEFTNELNTQLDNLKTSTQDTANSINTKIDNVNADLQSFKSRFGSLDDFTTALNS